MIADEIRKIKSTEKEWREFGLVVGAILVAYSLLAMWRGKGFSGYILAIGIFLISSGLFYPWILKYPQRIWMALGIVLGFFVSRIVLAVFFYCIVTPIGLLTRILGKDILDQRIEKEKDSYWKPRPAEAKTKESYENQY